MLSFRLAKIYSGSCAHLELSSLPGSPFDAAGPPGSGTLPVPSPQAALELARGSQPAALPLDGEQSAATGPQH